MKPVKYAITAYEHASFKKILRFKDEHDNLIDFTGYTALMHIREDPDNANILLELSTENGGLTIDPTLGKITIFIEEVLEEYAGVYDLLLFSPAGIRYKPIKTSQFKVIPGVTDEDDIDG